MKCFFLRVIEEVNISCFAAPWVKVSKTVFDRESISRGFIEEFRGVQFYNTKAYGSRLLYLPLEGIFRLYLNLFSLLNFRFGSIH
jgi:hypothetical protein